MFFLFVVFVFLLLGWKFGLSNKLFLVVWPKRMQADLKPLPRHAQESSQIYFKNNHRDSFNSCPCTLGTQWIQTNHRGFSSTAVSSRNLRHPGAHWWFINILYIHISDYNRWNYRKDMSNRACCYITCNCQSEMFNEYVKVLCCMCPEMPPSLIGLKYASICILFLDWWQVQALFCRTRRRKQKV